MMKLRLYINGMLFSEERCRTEIDIYETIALWHIKHELKRQMRFEIFLILPSKMNTSRSYETTDIDRIPLPDRN